MERQITKLTDPIVRTINSRRYFDGRWVDSKRTATATHVIENYLDTWTNKVVAIGYQIRIYDYLDDATSVGVISHEDFVRYWMHQV